MAIRMRQGNIADLDKTKLQVGEFAVAKDSEDVYIKTSAINTHRVLTDKDVYVVESGSKSTADSNWTYIKWSNGMAECWGNRWVGTIQSSEFSDWGGSTVYYTVPESTFPFAFAADPICINMVQNNSASAWCAQYSPSTTKTGKTGVIRPNAATVNNVEIVYHAFGKWK